jgi:ubiquinone/menaquinone biosynthesis C-methylase UbiE
MPRAGAGHAQRREFDREAREYDRTASESMPGYTDLHRALLGGIPFLPTRSFRVLELGVGTGTFTALLLATFPHAEVRGIDLSPRMIARARTKLRADRHRVELVAGDLGEFPEERYDAVVSALAIHHLSDPQKWSLFRRIHRALPRGGYFGDADDHLPEDPLFDQRYSQMAASLSEGARSGARWTTLQEVWHEHERYDHPCTLTAETAALDRAGFSHVGVPWRFFGQAVVWAYK